MKKLVLIVVMVFLPSLVCAATASDFKVNNQSTYAVPQSTTKVLILDLTLPAILKSIKIENAGTALQTDITRISIFEDGASAGWDGDEKEIVIQSSTPFWDTWLSGNFSQPRIFITANISANAVSTRTIQPQIKINAVEFASGVFGPTDQEILGLSRIILVGASSPTTPVAPIARNGEAIATSTIRWYFTDLSNNEFGFKILDGNLKEVARTEQADLSYLDEIGLQPNTNYSGRKVVAFNDQGENQSSALSVFPETKTLAPASVPLSGTTAGKEIIQETPVASTTEAEVEKEETVPEKTLFEKIQDKIIEIQLQINELVKQLSELLSQQAATVWQAFSGFLQSFLGK